MLTDLADYPPHFWIERKPQYFMCGTEKAVAQARAMGHADERIFRASGMILHPRFYEAPVENPVAERERLGLRPDLPTGLVLFGGHGSKDDARNCRAAEPLEARAAIDFDLRQERSAGGRIESSPWRVPHFIEGFTTRVNYYMQLSDFFIGKPGPGSVSEALAMHLPVIVECNAWTLPQERYNTEWVVEKEVGVVLRNFTEDRRGGGQADRAGGAGAIPGQYHEARKPRCFRGCRYPQYDSAELPR